MREYMVIFMRKGLPFHEYNRVYAVSRSKAIQTVREHYGKGAITIVRACLAEHAFDY
jgi:hypothetical protein